MLKGEVLVIASKVKSYVATKGGGMRTSGDVAEALTSRLEAMLDAAIAAAQRDKRQTLKARDFSCLDEADDAA